MVPVLKLAVVGGGVYVARLCDALMTAAALPTLNVSLTARNRDRLELIAAHCARRVRKVRPDWKVVACPLLQEAIADADLVLLMIRVGGLTARAYDEQFPSNFGLVGDEGLGPGGFANAWRTLPVLSEIAETICELAPHSQVLNLVAPLGITTRLLIQVGLQTIGICELPLIILRRLLTANAEERWIETFNYAGLNHLGWFWPKNSTGELVLREGVERGLVDPGTLARFEAAPLDYFYRVFDAAAAERLGYIRETCRAKTLLTLRNSILRRLLTNCGDDIQELAHRATPWFDHSVVPTIVAELTGVPYRGFVNVRNGTHLSWLPPNSVVELGATLTGRKVELVIPDRPPAAVTKFLQTMADAEDLCFQASQLRDPERMGEALRTLPLGIPPQRLAELVKAIVDGRDIGD